MPVDESGVVPPSPQCMHPLSLTGLTADEIETLTTGLCTGRDAARKLTYWLYRRQAGDFGMMTSLRKTDLQLLSQRFTTGIIHPASYQESADGTRKYLFRFSGNRVVETALMPGEKRTTLCLSSQAGCRMGCRFCNTALNGYNGQLTTGEIVTQLAGIPEAAKVTHIVVMGMGEPLDNLEAVLKSLQIITAGWGFALSPRHVTISSVGLMPEVKIIAEQTPYNLAISLHTPFAEERLKLMPSEKVSPAHQLIHYLKQHPFSKPRRLTFEYLLLKGVNHTENHATELAALLTGLPCHVNLIPFNQFPGSPFITPDEAAVMHFRDRLDDLGVMTTIRKSLGHEIGAACGMLAGKANGIDP